MSVKKRLTCIVIALVAVFVTLCLVHYGTVKSFDPNRLQSRSHLSSAQSQKETPHVLMNPAPAVYPEKQADKTTIATGQDDVAQTANALPNAAASMKDGQKIYYRDQVAVLTYHHIDPQESSVTITQERFSSHLMALKNNGFHVISIEDFADFLQQKKAVPPNAVIITFDDGYESVYKYAYPLLKAEGMPAAVFLIVSYVGSGTDRVPSILNWDEIAQMHNDGFSFYSHTYNSHDSVFVKGKEYSQLTEKLMKQGGIPETDAEYKIRIQKDLAQANEVLNAKLGNKLNMLCLPHGSYNQAVLDAAKQTDTKFLFTGNEGINSVGAKLINRINAGSPYMTDSLLIRKLTTLSPAQAKTQRAQPSKVHQQNPASPAPKTTARPK